MTCFAELRGEDEVAFKYVRYRSSTWESPNQFVRSSGIAILAGGIDALCSEHLGGVLKARGRVTSQTTPTAPWDAIISELQIPSISTCFPVPGRVRANHLLGTGATRVGGSDMRRKMPIKVQV